MKRSRRPDRTRRRPSLWLLLAAAGAGCQGGGESGPLPANGRPVVMISIDSLRADHCSAFGYRPRFAPEERTTPFLDRLAAGGVLFTSASSTTSWTLPAHMSLLTGMQCREHCVRNRSAMLARGTELLAGRFQRAGYETGGFYSGPFLHPSWGFGSGFDWYAPGSAYLADLDAVEAIADVRGKGSLHGLHDASHSDRLCSQRIVDRALDWLEEDRRYERPFFLFLHLWDPHYDYAPPEEYAARFDPDYTGSADGSGFMDPRRRWTGRDLQHLIALYDAEIRYTDDQIARFYARLEEWGIADRVILSVSSDHGEEFYEHGQKGHQKTLFEEVTHVPIVLHAPDGVPAGLRAAPTVSLCDVAPTLLDLAGVPAWPERTGRSLRPLWNGAAADREALMDLDMPAWKAEAWRRGPEKLIHDLNRGAFLFFDLGADPGERRGTPLQSLSGHPAGRKAAAAWRLAAGRECHAAPMEETAAMSAALAGVGYVDGAPEDDG